jgi:hypothetical protein
MGVLVGAAGVVALALVAAPAHAAMTEKQVAAKVAKDLDVEVLRVRAAKSDGRAVYLVTMMNPGGDFNTAFAVNTVAVDAETGELTPQFRHRPSGADTNAAPTYDAGRQGRDALQSGVVWR